MVATVQDNVSRRVLENEVACNQAVADLPWSVPLLDHYIDDGTREAICR